MTMTAVDPVVIDGAPLTSRDIVRIGRGSPVALGPVARERIVASRAVVDGLVGGERLIYGLNTGLGHMRNERLPLDEIAELQKLLVRGHAGGLGPPLSTAVVRAAMAVRIAGIARGGSGASPGIVETYVQMLNAGVHPLVPLVGSVGASDLMHMASVALVAMGEGEAEYGGERHPGAEALRLAGIDPVQLAPKDGLTVVSANGVSIGHGALVVDRAERLADAIDLVVAVSLEATRGNPSIVDTPVAAAKPVPGQAVASGRIRAYLEGSRLCSEGGPASVQDPLSFRVAPQVHGAFREVVAFAAAAVDMELAGMGDNPLVSPEDGRMISNGNFHPMLLALAVDSIRPALAHVAQLSDRRMGHIWDQLIADPASFSPEGLSRLNEYGSPLVRYSAAARAAELVSLAGPATLYVGALDLGVEDHSTSAPLAVRRTDEALDLAEDVVTAELLTATAAIGWREDGGQGMSPRTRAAFDLIAATIATMRAGSSSDRLHAAVREMLSGRVLDAASLDR